MNKRLKWFTERIGKTIFRNRDCCDCKVCEKVYQNGLTVHDEQHADCLCDNEGMSNYEGYPLKYSDTREEALKFETDNKDVIEPYLIKHKESMKELYARMNEVNEKNGILKKVG